MEEIILQHFKTVLGRIPESDVGITLVHEHICCYSEYVYTMYGDRYLDKKKLAEAAVSYLRQMKEKYGLQTFIDCTPVNIGRDLALLKEVSEKANINIISSTGFYYTEESLLFNTPVEQITDYIVTDAENTNAGIIKCAVQTEEISPLLEKILRACAKAQLVLGLPIVMHSNAGNQNGAKGLQILLSEGVSPQTITVGHLSDTEDMEYVCRIAESGCFIGFDRLYDEPDESYINRKVKNIHTLCEKGHADQVLLSHDALFFNGFRETAEIDGKPRFACCFETVLPRLSKELADTIMIQNPVRMLKCGR